MTKLNSEEASSNQLEHVLTPLQNSTPFGSSLPDVGLTQLLPQSHLHPLLQVFALEKQTGMKTLYTL